MIQALMPVATPPAPKRCNLLLHCGSTAVERQELTRVELPPATATWCPVPHSEILRSVEASLRYHHMKVLGEAHGLSHNGERYFGLLEVAAEISDPESSWVVGIRNSHDKRFSAGIVAGAQVLVCDNLSFSGEICFARKHTRNIFRDLPMIIRAAVERLPQFWSHHHRRTLCYREHVLTDHQVHDLAIRAVDHEVCPITMVPKVLEHWREPSYGDFAERTAWTLQNAFTEALKGNLPLLPARSHRLHQLLDAQTGFSH